MTSLRSPTTDALILQFGEMGSRWGISRTVAQIYALLLFTEGPRNADQIGATLGFSRSNVSMGLKELQGWGLIRRQHLPGDRKEYWSAPDDVWDIARTLLTERRRRELDPVLAVLDDALAERSEPGAGGTAYTRRRVAEIHQFITLVLGWIDDMQKLSSQDLQRLLRLGAGISKVLDAAGRRRRGTESDDQIG